MRIGILSNLQAGGDGVLVARVLDRLAKYPDIVHVETEHSHVAPDAMRALADAGIEILVVNGGDGTLQRSLTEVLCATSPFARPPLIAPLRSGRTCMSALDIGSLRDPVEALDRLVALAASGRAESAVVDRAVLHLALEPDGIDHYGTFFGAGVIHRAILLAHRLFPKEKGQGVLGSGLVTAGLITRALFGKSNHILDPDSIDVALDGEHLAEHQFQLLIATTLRRLFLRMRPFWGTGPGGLHFTALAPGTLRHPLTVAHILTGRAPQRADSDPRYVSRNVEEIRLHMDCGATLDGELFDPMPGRTARLLSDRRVRFLSTC